jgi:hypothetical protein
MLWKILLQRDFWKQERFIGEKDVARSGCAFEIATLTKNLKPFLILFRKLFVF